MRALLVLLDLLEAQAGPEGPGHRERATARHRASTATRQRITAR
jgi:hypothetical protein